MNQTTAVMIGHMITRDLYERTWWQQPSRSPRRRPRRARAPWRLRLAHRRSRVATA